MGFTLYYRSVQPVSPAKADAIRRVASAANEGRTWLSCEPVHFFPVHVAGHLDGASKPNFQPHPDDAAAAAREGLPDGTVRDLIEVLCALSRDHGVDWEISHDAAPGPIGFIRDGECDVRLLNQMEAFADVGEMLSGVVNDFEGEPDYRPTPMKDSSDDNNDDDDEPPILRLWPGTG